MPHFFATAEDLLPVLAAVESRLEIQYTLTGNHASKNIESWWHGRELPTFGQPSPVESAVSSPAYLITARGAVVNVRELPPIEGRERWAVDQLINPDSTVFWHGGLFGANVLLYGRVATVSKTPSAIKLQRAFEAAIRKSFARIKAYYVGGSAERLLDSGLRLTGAAQSPRGYDLSR
jgi:hypothetical protein